MPRAAAIPRRHLVILTCMDVRIEPERVLGLTVGDAHILRNAGAVVSEDVLRSLVLSQRLLETRAVAIVAHTDCGLDGLDASKLTRALTAEAGREPPFAFAGFTDVEAHVHEQVARVEQCAWLQQVDDVRGYVLDVDRGDLRQVAGSEETPF